ncbi:MAG TPA: DUF4097 family beta strand repeat-containing protein [Candidatus Baltobacteraceae bacterium]
MGSRAGVIAMLIAVEIAIVGLAIFSMAHARGVWGRGPLNSYNYTGKPIAPLAAGSTPHVVVDDSNDQVVVTASTDNLVHVADLTSYHGSGWGSPQIQPLTVTRTADGVSITRPSNDVRVDFNFLGSSVEEDRITIALPVGSAIDIQGCAGADVTGVNGKVTVRSQDGQIALATLRGDVDVASNDGSIQSRDVIAPTFSASTDDGSVTIDGLHVTGKSATIHSNDGSVTVAGDFAGSGTYEVSTDDGRIALTLPSTANLVVAASTNDGSVSRDGRSLANGDGDNSGTFTLGGGSGRLNVSSHDGSISIMTNGAT